MGFRRRLHPPRRLPVSRRPAHRPLRLRPPVVEPADLEAVARQLGREPRGVLEIAYRCPNGEPAVVKTAPKLPDGTPFPTLYYLTHPTLTAAASRLESSGMMREMTERLQQDPELAAAYRRAKSGKHPAFALHLLYWHLPAAVTGLKRTPPSWLREMAG